MTQKNEIIEWVGRGNTNPAVLGSMIDGLESGGSGGPSGNIVNITNNSSGNPSVDGRLITPDGIYASSAYNIPSGNSKLFAYNGFNGTDYTVQIWIVSESDNYTITINGETLAYSRENYTFNDVSTDTPITGQTYNVVITDKE